MRPTARLAAPFLIMTAVLAAAFITISAAASDGSALFISEVCPHNDEIMYDKIGFYSDYIVLTNPSEDEVSLEGWSLSDDKAQLSKFSFGDISLGANESITVWAEPQTELEHGYIDEDAIYTGFRLRDHEYLFLTDPDGVIVDSLRIPAMDRNRALIRTCANDRGKEGTPAEADADPLPISEIIAPPVMSVPSGFYEDPFVLDIDGGGYTVYFTVDGSSPYTSGMGYSEPFPVYDRSDQPNYYTNMVPVSNVEEQYVPTDPVSKATVVRAVCQAEDGTFSEESVATYFVGKGIRSVCSSAYTLSLVSDPEGLFSGARGIYVTGHIWDMNMDAVAENDKDPVYAPTNYNMRGKGWRRNARLTLFDPAGNCLYDENDLVAIRGKSARSSNQKGFNLRPEELDKKVFDGLFEVTGATLSLRCAGGLDQYVTNMRDALNNRVIKNMRLGAVDTLCCQLYLDGEYWGCYDLRQHLDAGYIEALYGVDAANVNLIKNDVPVTGFESDLMQYKEIESFALENDFSDEKNYSRFCEMVDIDSLIDFYCGNIFLANDDAYVNNHALWRVRNTGTRPYEDGKWYHLLYDLDNSTGYWGTAYAELDSFVEGNDAHADPLNEETYFPNLWKNQDFRDRFYERFTYLLDNDFSYERTGPVIDEMERIYEIPMILSVRRYNDPKYDDRKFHENVAIIRDFFKRRPEIIRGFLEKHMGE